MIFRTRFLLVSAILLLSASWANACEITFSGPELTPPGNPLVVYDFTSVTAHASNCGTPPNGGEWHYGWRNPVSGQVLGTGASFSIPLGGSGFATPGRLSIRLSYAEFNDTNCVSGCGGGNPTAFFYVARRPGKPSVSVSGLWKQRNSVQWFREVTITPNDPDPIGEPGNQVAGVQYEITGGSILEEVSLPDGVKRAKVFTNVGALEIRARTSNSTDIANGNTFAALSDVTVSNLTIPTPPPPTCSAGQTCGGGSPGGNLGGGPPNNGGCTRQNQMTSCGMPVNVSSGAHWDETRDFQLPGRTPSTALTFDRVYTAHAATAEGDFGPNWRHSYETTLLVHGIGSATWIDEHGAPWTFPYKSELSTEFNSPIGLAAQLVQVDGHVELRKEDRTVLHFDPDGKLLKVVDRFGQAKTMSYDSEGKLASVSSPLAGTITFTRNSAGKITSVARSRDSLVYTYTYDDDGRLSKATDFDNKSYEYTYVTDMPGTLAQGMLASIKDPLGRTHTFTYYANGRAFQQFESGGGTRTFVYNETSGVITSTTVTEIDGGVSTYKFDSRGRTIEFDQPDGSKKFSTWNAAGFLATQKDELGFNTVFGYDANGNINSLQRPEDPAPTLITYNQTFNVPTLMTPPIGAPTQYTLNPDTGAVTHLERTSSGTTLALDYTHDAFGNVLSTNNGRATYTDVRDSNGLLTQVFDAHNPEQRSYDGRARISTRTFQSGRVLNYTYDDYDRVISVSDNSGPTTNYNYDVMGRLLTKTITDGHKPQVTTYQWDSHDRLLSETDPLGRITSYAYETARILKDPASITDPAGRVTSFIYDVMGRKASKTEPNGATTYFAYNARGDLTSITDANGNVTSYEYDGNRRKIAEIRPSVQGTTAVQQRTEYTYDALDRLVFEEHKSTSGGQSRIITYQYDGFDRLVKKTLKVGSTVEEESVFTYEQQLDAKLMASANNSVADLGFNHEPRPPFSSVGFSVAAHDSGNPYGLIQDQFTVTRDVTGEIASVAGANSGLLFTKAYDAAGRLIGVDAGALKTALQYDGFGRKRGLAHSDGAAQRVAYDSLNRITAIKWKEGRKDSVSEQLSYDLAGNITKLYRENARYHLSYDANDQLIGSQFVGVQGVPDYNRSFQYDLMGNRLNDSLNGNGSYVSNFLLSNAKSVFEADEHGFGETVKEKSAEFEKKYVYRADQRMTGFQGNGIIATYLYDGLDRRVAKIIQENNSSYSQSYLHLNEEDRILMGKAGDGSATLYIDGSGVDEHLGEVKGVKAKAYIKDHLGSIVNGDIASLSRIFGLFGESRDSIKTSVAAAPVQYGFTGREFDSESGLNYHRARSYSQTLGRWLSQDSSGYESDDLNYFRYVSGNPIKYKDLRGLEREGDDPIGDPFKTDPPGWLEKIINYCSPPAQPKPPAKNPKDSTSCYNARIALWKCEQTGVSQGGVDKSCRAEVLDILANCN